MDTPLDSFQGADGLLGYPRLDVDTAKVPYVHWNGVLRNLEALTSVGPAEDVYTMDMRNNSSSYEGAVCGFRYLGSDYKLIFFGFPLYFMDQDQARLTAQQVMTDFGETGVDELPKELTPVSQLMLGQNTPNPFTEQTVLNYQLPTAGDVSLKIYNIAGQLVKTLVDTQQRPGVYNIIWSGLDSLGRRVSSGVYFCRLECKTQSDIKKMTILR